MAQNAGVTEWSELLEATHLALSTLRLDDLDKLAARAQEMLEAAAVRNPGPRVKRQFGQNERRKVRDAQRLLGSLLNATDKNLEVFRRLRGSLPGRSGTGGLDSRWVR